MRRRPSLLSALALLIGVVGSGGGADDDIDRLFARAERDAAGVTPLILGASAVIPRLPRAEGAALADRLAPFCRRAFASGERLPGMDRLGLVLHTVAAGETRTRLAARRRIGVDLIARLNDDGPPRRGQRVKLLDLATRRAEVVVSLSTRRLLVWRGLVLIAAMPVGIGKAQTPTPLGTTTIANRVRHPAWRNPDDGRLLAPDDPDNHLGGYWLGFAWAAGTPARRFKGIGIHGWTGDDPQQWLGRDASHGCLRLRQEDIALVFALVLPGTRVSVRR